MVETQDQAEIDRYRDAIISHGGAEKRVPLVQGPLGLLLADHAPTAAARPMFDAMMTMRKIDAARIEAAWRGDD